MNCGSSVVGLLRSGGFPIQWETRSGSIMWESLFVALTVPRSKGLSRAFFLFLYSWICPRPSYPCYRLPGYGHGFPCGEQGWRSGESTRLPPMWPGFKPRRQRNMWVEFVVGSLLCFERFFSGYTGFPLSSKTNISKFQFDQESGGWRTTMWMCYLQIAIYFMYLFIVEENSHAKNKGGNSRLIPVIGFGTVGIFCCNLSRNLLRHELKKKLSAASQQNTKESPIHPEV